MTHTTPFRQKARRFGVILGPIIVTQVGLSAIGAVDAMMSGHYGATDLAGVAIGVNLWFPVYTGLSGILAALTPIVAQLLGAGRSDMIRRSVLQGIYLAIALALTVTGIGLFIIEPLLGAIDLEAAVRHVARHYLIGLAWGLAPLFVYSILRSFIDAHGYTRITMLITLAALPINVFFNYALIFGRWGFPRLGGAGAGYASAITYWLICLMALGVVARMSPFAQYHIFHKLRPPSWSTWKEQLRIGIPIGASIFLEVSVFSVVALLMSRFGTVAIAAHQAAINVASLLYMAPLSISMALTIAVGHEVGARRIKDARQYSLLGISLSVCIALFVAIGLALWREPVARLFTNEPAVLELIRTFLGFAVFFQLSDAVAAPIQGALRGYKDVTVVAGLALFSYWVVGLPVGHALAALTSLGPLGYWVGLISGLAVGAAGLSLRLRRTEKAFLSATPGS